MGRNKETLSKRRFNLNNDDDDDNDDDNNNNNNNNRSVTTDRTVPSNRPERVRFDKTTK